MVLISLHFILKFPLIDGVFLLQNDEMHSIDSQLDPAMVTSEQQWTIRGEQYLHTQSRKSTIALSFLRLVACDLTGSSRRAAARSASPLRRVRLTGL